MSGSRSLLKRLHIRTQFVLRVLKTPIAPAHDLNRELKDQHIRDTYPVSKLTSNSAYVRAHPTFLPYKTPSPASGIPIFSSLHFSGYQNEVWDKYMSCPSRSLPEINIRKTYVLSLRSKKTRHQTLCLSQKQKRAWMVHVPRFRTQHAH